MVGLCGSVVGVARMRSPPNAASGARRADRTIERTSHCSTGNADIVNFPTARIGPGRMSDGCPHNIVAAAKTLAEIFCYHLRYICGRTTPPQTAYPAGVRASRLEPRKTKSSPGRSSESQGAARGSKERCEAYRSSQARFPSGTQLGTVRTSGIVVHGVIEHLSAISTGSLRQSKLSDDGRKGTASSMEGGRA